MKTVKTKTKPKCVKGTACGFTCINAKSQCSDKVLKRKADALIKSATKTKNSNSSLPKAFDRYDNTHDATIELDVPPDTVEVSINSHSTMSHGPLGVFVDNAVKIDIYVNDNIDAEDSNASKGNSIRIAMLAMRATIKHIATMPDGTLLTNNPNTGDGNGKARYKLYERAGFKTVESGSEAGSMYAVVKDGKITPVDIDYVKANYKTN